MDGIESSQIVAAAERCLADRPLDGLSSRLLKGHVCMLSVMNVFKKEEEEREEREVKIRWPENGRLVTKVQSTAQASGLLVQVLGWRLGLTRWRRSRVGWWTGNRESRRR